MKEVLKKGIYTGTKKHTRGRAQHVQSVPVFVGGNFEGYRHISHYKKDKLKF